MDQDAVRAHLTGPVSSVTMPFNEDGSIDEEGLRNFIDSSIAGGSRSIILTAGDSHYFCLSDEEIARVTRIACEHTAGRAMVVAADYFYSTSRALEFAQYARDVGADIYMLLPPTWGGCTPEDLAAHYVSVAEVMPVMVVTAVFGQFSDSFALETLRIMLDKSEGIMAIKDDRCEPFVHQMCLECHDRCAIFAGGTKRLHLSMMPFGCDGYMSTFVTLKPELSARYWEAVTAQDFATARKIIADYEAPLRQYLRALPGGWNSGAHALLELYGVAKRWKRKPYTSLDDRAMEEFAAFLKSKELL